MKKQKFWALLIAFAMLFSFLPFRVATATDVTNVVIASGSSICRSDVVQVSAYLDGTLSYGLPYGGLKNWVDAGGYGQADFTIELWYDKVGPIGDAKLCTVTYRHKIQENYGYEVTIWKLNGDGSEASECASVTEYFSSWDAAEQFYRTLTAAPTCSVPDQYINNSNETRLIAKVKVSSFAYASYTQSDTYTTGVTQSNDVIVTVHNDPAPYISCSSSSSSPYEGQTFTVNASASNLNGYGDGKDGYLTISYTNGLRLISGGIVRTSGSPYDDLHEYDSGSQIWKACPYTNGYFFIPNLTGATGYSANVKMNSTYKMYELHYTTCNAGFNSNYQFTFKAIKPGPQHIWVHFTVNSGYIDIDSSSHPGRRTFYAAGSATDQQGWQAKEITVNVVNRPPSLSSPQVSPSSGDPSTTFTYTVHYTDPDGDSPTTKQVYIDGNSYTMSLQSGTASDGTYSYSTTLSPGSHSYCFKFNDGNGHEVTTDTYNGPTVSYPILTVNVTGPSSGQVNTNYTFTANASGGTGSYTYSWSSNGLVSHSGNTATYRWSSSGTKTVTCTVTSGSQTKSDSATISISEPPDFTISASPSSRSVTQGSSTTYTITLTAQNGFNSSVSLSASGLPSGTNASFNPQSVTPTGSSTLTISASSSTPTGSHTITITASGGGKTHQTSVTLNVNQSVIPPSAPQNLTATAGDSQITLTWQAPSNNGGASITSYKIYRGTSSGNETYLTSVNGNITSYTDTGLTNGTRYYYKVSAVNSAGEGPKSDEKSATPQSNSSRIISIPDTQSAPGSSVTIPINVNDADGIAGGDFTITFNSNILTATDVQLTSLTNGFLLTKNLNNAGEVTISLASTSGISDPNHTGGALVNITFTVSSSAQSGAATTLSFTKSDIKDENGNNIPSTSQNGTFTVGGTLGDVNGDGSIDSGDAILILRYSAGLITLTPSQLARADVNKDGSVDSGDAILVLRYAAGLINHF